MHTDDVLKNGLAEIAGVLKKNEAIHDKLLIRNEKNHTSFLQRFIVILYICISLFVLFFAISSLYIYILVSNMRETQSIQSEEYKQHEKVKMTVDKFEEMWNWYYAVIDTDTLFRRFANKDSILYKSEEANLLTNININKYYNYFEILKSLDMSNLIDRAAAENLFHFFTNIGIRSQTDSVNYYADTSHRIKNDSMYYVFNYIEIKRLLLHEKLLKTGTNQTCICGKLFDGYEYIFKNVFHVMLSPTKTNDLGNE